jgi:hypothetical protein
MDALKARNRKEETRASLIQREKSIRCIHRQPTSNEVDGPTTVVCRRCRYFQRWKDLFFNRGDGACILFDLFQAFACSSSYYKKMNAVQAYQLVLYRIECEALEERVRRSTARSNTLSKLVRADESRDKSIRLKAAARRSWGLPISHKARRVLVLAAEEKEKCANRALSWGPPPCHVLAVGPVASVTRAALLTRDAQARRKRLYANLAYCPCGFLMHHDGPHMVKEELEEASNVLRKVPARVAVETRDEKARREQLYANLDYCPCGFLMYLSGP